VDTKNASPDISVILERYPNASRDDLIPILQEVQEEAGFLSRESVIIISRHLNLPASKIYGVATFYNQFRFQGIGRYHVQVCRGTACHVKGSLKVLETITRELKIQPGQTTRDGLFSIEVVACIGACGLAPVININGEFYAQLTPEKVTGIIDTLRKEAERDGNN
jgi:NADH-quinone oxidoreductase E subunit